MKLLRRICVLAPLILAGCVEPPIIVVEDESALRKFYAAAEVGLRRAGLLRTDTAPADAPFTVDDLVANFERIALYDEYSVTAGRYVARQTRTHLRRWEGLVRVAVISGASTPTATRTRDLREVTRYTARLAELTGADMEMAPEEDANLLVMFLSRSERAEFAATLPDWYPGIDKAVIDAFLNSPINIFCAAFAFPIEGRRGVYGRSLILVKSEHGNLMRKSCIHEEMAQAMGLSNDSRKARPSIFNDDEEFALLTAHDEILLQMLYDPRLKAGMFAREVLPLLPDIARDAMGGF